MGVGTGEGSEQNQTSGCQSCSKMRGGFLFFVFVFVFLAPVLINRPLLLTPGILLVSLSRECSGHAQMHSCEFCFLKEGGILREERYPTSTSNTQAACSSVQ